MQWDFIAACTSPELYDSYMTLSPPVKEELTFWATLPVGLSSPITMSDASATVTTDASEFGIGILFKGSLISEEISAEYRDFHINVKELLALDR